MTLPLYAHLPILIVVISLVYSATRYDRWDNILREAFRWGLRMAGFLCLIGIIMFVLAEWGLVVLLLLFLVACLIGVVLFVLSRFV